MTKLEKIYDIFEKAKHRANGVIIIHPRDAVELCTKEQKTLEQIQQSYLPLSVKLITSSQIDKPAFYIIEI